MRVGKGTLRRRVDNALESWKGDDGHGSCRCGRTRAQAQAAAASAATSVAASLCQASQPHTRNFQRQRTSNARDGRRADGLRRVSRLCIASKADASL